MKYPLNGIIDLMNLNRSRSTKPVWVNKDLLDCIPDQEISVQGYQFKFLEKKDIITEFLKLPAFVVFEGIEFELKLFNNNSEESRLVYSFHDIYENSPHNKMWDEYGCFENRLLNNKRCSFLFLYEGITDENQFLYAILEARKFLLKMD